MESKKEPIPSYKSPISGQQKLPTNYAEINVNRNLPSYQDKRVPNISEKDKYGRN